MGLDMATRLVTFQLSNGELTNISKLEPSKEAAWVNCC